MNEEMMKSLVALIDESLAEIEELKKSDRFSASEIKIEGPGAGIDGKPSNGSLGKEEDKKDEDKDEDEKKDKKDMDKKEDMDKDEGKNRESDPNGGKHEVVKGEMSAGPSDGSSSGSAAGKNREADPNGGKHQVAKKEEDKKDEDKDEKKEDKKDDMKKSLDEHSALFKSYVDQRISPIETQLETIKKLVEDIANTPAPAKSVSYKDVQPLKKSEGESETLSKSDVVTKLFDLKKSGTRVDSVDIASAELASGADLAKIAHKYNIK